MFGTWLVVELDVVVVVVAAAQAGRCRGPFVNILIV